MRAARPETAAPRTKAALAGATILLSAALLAPQSAKAVVAPEDAALYAQLRNQVMAVYDSARGGWVTSHGVPDPSSVALALAIARENGPPLWLVRALNTVDWTWTLFDSTGGGFLERADNVKQYSASFEKRTDSNAARLENLIDAWQVTGDERYHSHAEQSADYFDRVLLDGRGGFIDGQVANRLLIPQSNGTAIHAWLRWAVATANPHIRNFALLSLDRCWSECWVEGMGMMRKDEFAEITHAPELEDQVEMGRAFVLGAHIGGRSADLDRAKLIADLVMHNFSDPKKGGWREQAVLDGKGGFHSAPRDFRANARAALFLCELATVTGEAGYRDVARASIETWTKELAKAEFASADWALMVRALGGADLPAKPEWQGSTSPKPTTGKKK
jgi:uncharacterized protein YyaL (SSP411 family)